MTTALTRTLPDSTSDAWGDPATVAVLAGLPHDQIHSVPQADCNVGWCKPVPCVCGVTDCAQAFEHRRAVAGAESSWRVAT